MVKVSPTTQLWSRESACVRACMRGRLRVCLCVCVKTAAHLSRQIPDLLAVTGLFTTSSISSWSEISLLSHRCREQDEHSLARICPASLDATPEREARSEQTCEATAG